MPPRKRARGAQPATASAIQDHDAMDIDEPSEKKSTDLSENAQASNMNHYWNDDQVASLFKAVIRWKPAGMHRYFRMIAISEHLRNHGFDPDVYSHTRIPHIWQKLRAYYNLELIDERELYDDDEMDEKYVEFTLPKVEYYDAMIQRAIRDSSESATSSPEPETTHISSPPKKRKLRDSTSRGHGTSVADTEDGTDVPSPAATTKPTRASRGKARAISQPKEKPEKVEARKQRKKGKDDGKKVDEDEDEKVEDEEDEENEDDEEEEEGEGEGEDDDDDEDEEEEDEEGGEEDEGEDDDESRGGKRRRRRGNVKDEEKEDEEHGETDDHSRSGEEEESNAEKASVPKSTRGTTRSRGRPRSLRATRRSTRR